MARFVKMVSVPTRHVQKNSAWQEATWKNIKCTFRVLQWRMKSILIKQLCAVFSCTTWWCKSFCGMYDPHEENDDATINLMLVMMARLMMTLHSMYSVQSRSTSLFASHREADKHVYDSILKDEKLWIAFLPHNAHHAAMMAAAIWCWRTQASSASNHRWAEQFFSEFYQWW